MRRLHSKENVHSMNLETQSLPPERLGRKRRRSSILKPQRPFTDVQNLTRDDSRSTGKDRRVSFCPTIEIKEFHRHNPADPTSEEEHPVAKCPAPQRNTADGEVKQESLATVAEEVPQMSTPVKKKKRRISAASQIARLSMIPKFEKSFVFPDDDFSVFEEEPVVLPPATAAREDITLMEELLDPGDKEEDVLLDLDLNEAPAVSSLQLTHTLTQLPKLTADDAQRLAELFPGVAPIIIAPSIQTTPPESGEARYLAMPTPEASNTPQRRVRRRVSLLSSTEEFGSGEGVGVGGGEGVGVGGCDKELAGGSENTTPPSRTTLIDPRSMSLTCTNSHLSTLHTLTETTPTSIGASSNPATATVAMSLTCVEDGNTSIDKIATTGSGSHDGHVTSRSSPLSHPDVFNTTFTIANTTSYGLPTTSPAEKFTLSLDSHVDVEESQVSMDLTCHSDTTLQTSQTSGQENSPANEEQSHTDHTAVVAERQRAKPEETYTVDLEETHTAGVGQPVVDPRGSPPTQRSLPEAAPPNPVFKAPKGPPLRSQLRLLKSSGKRVVTASPVVRTPQLTPRHISSSLSRTPLNSTHTIPTHTSGTPSMHLKHPTPQPREDVVSSLLPSPAPSLPSPLNEAPAGSPWLQSPGDSFNLVNSEDNTPREQSLSPPPQPQDTADPPPAAPQATPLTDHTPIPTGRLASALQKLKVSVPLTSHPLPVSIETPEAALVVPDPPPAATAVSNTLPPSLPPPAELNDTTHCNQRSMLLSNSIYDKFVGQIWSKKDQSGDCEEEEGSPECSDQENSVEVELMDSSSPETFPLFNNFLSDLISRVEVAFNGVQQRLGSSDYCSSHETFTKVLDKWSRVFAACLGTLTVLERYGELSGASETDSWESEKLPEIPTAPSGQADMTGTRIEKLLWIREMIDFYGILRPIAELARDEAGRLYDWLFEEWSQDSAKQNVVVVLGSESLHFQLTVTDIANDRVKSTDQVTQAVWRHMNINGSN